MIRFEIECAALQVILTNTTDRQPRLSDGMIREMGCLSISGRSGLLCESTGSFHTNIKCFDFKSE